MNFSRSFIIVQIYLVLWLSLPFGCRTEHGTKDIVKMMKEYDRLLVKMDTDSLSQLYAPDGELGNIAKGPDSIRKFLNRFSSYRVLLNKSTTDTIIMNNDTAYQKGKYWQMTILPNKDTARLSGRFEATWRYLEGSGWKVQKMVTKPLDR